MSRQEKEFINTANIHQGWEENHCPWLTDCLMLDILICPNSALSYNEVCCFQLDCLRKPEGLWNQGPGWENQNYQPLILDTPVTFLCSCCFCESCKLVQSWRNRSWWFTVTSQISRETPVFQKSSYERYKLRHLLPTRWFSSASWVFLRHWLRCSVLERKNKVAAIVLPSRSSP